jgi:hypothetical protein
MDNFKRKYKIYYKSKSYYITAFLQLQEYCTIICIYKMRYGRNGATGHD